MKNKSEEINNISEIFEFNLVLFEIGCWYAVNAMIALQDNKEYLDLIIFSLNKYYEDEFPEIIESLHQENNSKVIEAIKKFPSDKESLAKIEQKYFKYIFNIIEEHEQIGPFALEYIIEYFQDDKNSQNKILKNIDVRSIEMGIYYAASIKKYELANFLKSFKYRMPHFQEAYKKLFYNKI